MKKQDTTQENLNKIIEFRQAIHAYGFGKQRDALSEALDAEWLSRHLAQQVPQTGIQHFSLDGSAWQRPRARTMDDSQYVYHPTAAVNGGSTCIGYPYSLLDWVP